jgi:negative regulator of sigma E activity
VEFEGPIRRTREGGGSEWEPIKILLEGDGYSNKTNTASNTRLRLTTQVGQVHIATGVLLNLGTNFQTHRPENAAEQQNSSPLTNAGQTGEHHRSDRSQPESPKTPNRPTELQTDPNSKQQQHRTTANTPKHSVEQKPNKGCTGQTGAA